MLALLYDIHGNTAALEAVLAEAESLGADRYLLGGDFGPPTPSTLETLELLDRLPNAVWLRGNTERWLRDTPELDWQAVHDAFADFRETFPVEQLERLYRLPAQAELEGMLFVHGSPLSDVQSFAPEPQEDEGRMLAGVRDRTVVFGHSHQQFRRPGPDGTDLVNPGSVGMPLDGDPSAAWATWDGDFEFRRTEYDVARAAAMYRELGGELGEWAARRVERGSD